MPRRGGTARSSPSTLSSPSWSRRWRAPTTWNTGGGATLSLIHGGELKNTLYLKLGLDEVRAKNPTTGWQAAAGINGFYAARVGCFSTDANGVVTPTATAQVGLLSLDEFTHEVYSAGRSGCSSVELGDKWPCASVYAWACDTHNWWRFPVVGTVARGWG